MPHPTLLKRIEYAYKWQFRWNICKEFHRSIIIIPREIIWENLIEFFRSLILVILGLILFPFYLVIVPVWYVLQPLWVGLTRTGKDDDWSRIIKSAEKTKS